MEENIYGKVIFSYTGDALKKYKVEQTKFEKIIGKKAENLFNPNKKVSVYLTSGCEKYTDKKEIEIGFNKFKNELDFPITVIMYGGEDIIRIGVNDGSEYSKAFSNDYTSFYFKMSNTFKKNNGFLNHELILEIFKKDLNIECESVFISKKVNLK